MNYNKYDVGVVFYLILKDKTKSAYEIAKYWNNVGNDDEYKKSLDKMIHNKEVIEKEGYYELVFSGMLANPEIKRQFKVALEQNLDRFKEILSKTKYTFFEWIKKVLELRDEFIKQGLLNNPEFLNQFISFFNKK